MRKISFWNYITILSTYIVEVYLFNVLLMKENFENLADSNINIICCVCLRFRYMYNKTYRHDMIEIVLKVMLKRDTCSKKKNSFGKIQKFYTFFYNQDKTFIICI